MNDLRNFNETFRKDVTDHNIKSHKKANFYTPFRRYIFGKTTVGVKLTPPAILLLSIPKKENIVEQNVKLNDVVVDNTTRSHWPLARIVEVCTQIKNWTCKIG